MKQRKIRDMTHDYWLIFEENYVQKIKKTRKQVKENDGETSNDEDSSTLLIFNSLVYLY